MTGALTAIMQDKEIRKAFGARVKELRKVKRWTQKELATKLGARVELLNKYECGVHVPPPEKLVELAEVLETSVDYLLTGGRSQEGEIHNKRLFERFRALEGFGTEDQEAVILLVDALIVKRRMEGAMKPIGQAS